MKRKAITDKMKWQALLCWNGIRCPECFAPVEATEEMEWDHRQALIHGGEHHYSNIRVMHTHCHARKTARDVKANAKVKRLAKGPKKPKGRKMQSKPFPKVHHPMRRA